MLSLQKNVLLLLLVMGFIICFMQILFLYPEVTRFDFVKYYSVLLLVINVIFYFYPLVELKKYHKERFLSWFVVTFGMIGLLAIKVFSSKSNQKILRDLLQSMFQSYLDYVLIAGGIFVIILVPICIYYFRIPLQIKMWILIGAGVFVIGGVGFEYLTVTMWNNYGPYSFEHRLLSLFENWFEVLGLLILTYAAILYSSQLRNEKKE